MQQLRFERLNSSDDKLIEIIAGWYHAEWKIPQAETIERLSTFKDLGLPCHFIVKSNEIPVATGGLYTDAGVGLLKVFPHYKKIPLWIALVYTLPAYRGQGLAAYLCNRIEQYARAHGLKKLNLYTNTAEKLYLKESWIPLERIIYKDTDTVIMEKLL